MFSIDKQIEAHCNAALPAIMGARLGASPPLPPDFPDHSGHNAKAELGHWLARRHASRCGSNPRPLEADGRARGHDTQPPLEALPTHLSAHLLRSFITHSWYLILPKQSINTELILTTSYTPVAVPTPAYQQPCKARIVSNCRPTLPIPSNRLRSSCLPIPHRSPKSTLPSMAYYHHLLPRRKVTEEQALVLLVFTTSMT